MDRFDFGLETPTRTPQREYPQPDYSLGRVELVSQGAYSALMLDALLKRRVPVTSYVVNYISTRVDVDSLPEYIKVRTFTTLRGLDRVIGYEQHIVLFNPGVIIPEDMIKRLRDDRYDFWNIHPSNLPKHAGVADPVKEMVKDGKEYGYVTIHRVSSKRDAGKVIAKTRFKFKPSPRGQDYSSRLVSEIYRNSMIPGGARLLKRVLEDRKDD